jgi:hypothetical protein
MTERSLLDVARGLKDGEERERLVSKMSRDEWLGEVSALLRTIREWLRPAVGEGLARVEPTQVRLSDAPFGDYDAPALKITLPGSRVVWVRPAGVLSVGAKGWVDVTCNASRAMLVLNRSGVWKIRSPDGGSSRLEPLDEPRFADVVAQLVA